jgi:hypothetical protein
VCAGQLIIWLKFVETLRPKIVLTRAHLKRDHFNHFGGAYKITRAVPITHTIPLRASAPSSWRISGATLHPCARGEDSFI